MSYSIKATQRFKKELKQLSKKCDYLINISWTLHQNERGKYLNDYTDDKIYALKKIAKSKKVQISQQFGGSGTEFPYLGILGRKTLNWT